MGGFGTWMCLNESPTRFAAAAPICGGAKPDWAEKLVNVPVWAFHGDQDFLVTLDKTENIVGAIRKAGGKKVIFTVYEGVGHDSWTQTYANQLFYDWLLQQEEWDKPVMQVVTFWGKKVFRKSVRIIRFSPSIRYTCKPID
jgi:predicted peptidase